MVSMSNLFLIGCFLLKKSSGFITPPVVGKNRILLSRGLKMKRSAKHEVDNYKLSDGIVPKTDNQIKYVKTLQNKNNNVIIVSGPAGTGKTHIAEDATLRLSSGSIEKIIITRPIVSVDNEELGFLPGKINSKMAHGQDLYLTYYQSIIHQDNLKEWCKMAS